MYVAPLNWTWMTLMICGIIAAAPAPWTNLAAISTPMPGASPHVSEASVNTPTPSRNIRRRPTRSPSRAPVISSIAYLTVYPATTSCSSAPEARSDRPIVGIATLTIVASGSAMNCPASSTTSIT